MTLYEQYERAEYLINQGLIRKDISASRPEGYVKTPGDRMRTMEKFLLKSGTGGRDIPAIHITGTSGKGTTAAITARLLKDAGLKVGLHTSPYLQSATEKIVIDGRYISANGFAELVDWIMPAAKEFLSPLTPASIHGMASVAIALEAFKRADVDVIVFEAGCGGRFDLTRFINTKVAVITNVGLDHVVSLGPSIDNIAWHKAGIIIKGSTVLSGAAGSAGAVIKKEAEELGCPFRSFSPSGTAMAQNINMAGHAAEAFIEFYQASASVNQKSVKSINAGSSDFDNLLPGRMEKMPQDDTSVFLDGAHNGEKLKAAVANALKHHTSGPRVVLAGLLGSKATTETVAALKDRFDHIVATEPVVYGKQSYPASLTAELLKSEKCTPQIEVDPFAALKTALKLASGGTLLITGSFYLCGQLREYWFSKRDVVLNRTSRPEKNLF
jgi:dihydrofolate synthase/folylpolyglutamate synthase